MFWGRVKEWSDREVIEKYIVESTGAKYVRNVTCPIKGAIKEALLAIAKEVRGYSIASATV